MDGAAADSDALASAFSRQLMIEEPPVKAEAGAGPLPPAQDAASRKRSAVLLCDACFAHGAVDHQETPLRLDVLCGEEKGVFRREAFGDLDLVIASEAGIGEALVSDVLRVHEWSYLKHLRERCAALAGDGAAPDGGAPKAAGAPAFASPSAGGEGRKLSPTPRPRSMLDVDTVLTKDSLRAALCGAGGAIWAIDRVVRGERANAFVICRPPGHHAGPRGSVASAGYWRHPDNSGSIGFCLLNNAAIAASYALSTYGRGPSALVRRVAIVDFDIHHGNGTEECVKGLSPRSVALPLPGSWAPVHREAYKPWLGDDDGERVFFGSINMFAGDDFYPGSGSGEGEDDEELYPNIVNVALQPLKPAPGDAAGRARLTPQRRRALCEKASAQFREAVAGRLMPRLRAFAPDLLIMCAGFDGIASDHYHYLTKEDFHWVTAELLGVCGRAISVLEGGYDIAPAAKEEHAGHATRGQQRRMDRTPRKAEAAREDGPLRAADGGLALGAAAHVLALMGRPLP